MRAQFSIRRPMYTGWPAPHEGRESGGCGDEYGPAVERLLRRRTGPSIRAVAIATSAASAFATRATPVKNSSPIWAPRSCARISAFTPEPREDPRLVPAALAPDPTRGQARDLLRSRPMRRALWTRNGDRGAERYN